MMDPKPKKTLVLGASPNPARYSYLAVNRLRDHGHPVVAIGGKLGAVADLEIGTEKKQIDQLDTVSIYLRPPIQEMYYDYIISLHPKRVIFNPGAENLAFEQLLATNGIEALEACTLVLLSTNQY